MSCRAAVLARWGRVAQLVCWGMVAYGPLGGWRMAALASAAHLCSKAWSGNGPCKCLVRAAREG